MLFVRLFDLLLFGFVCFLFLLESGKGCGLWPSLDLSLTFLKSFLQECLSDSLNYWRLTLYNQKDSLQTDPSVQLKVNKRTKDLIQADPHQAPKRKDEQTQ